MKKIREFIKKRFARNPMKGERGAAGIAAVLTVVAIIAVIGVVMYLAYAQSNSETIVNSAISVVRDVTNTANQEYARYAPTGLQDLTADVFQKDFKYIPVYGGKTLADYIGKGVSISTDQPPTITIQFAQFSNTYARVLDDIRAKLGGDEITISFDTTQNKYVCNAKDTDTGNTVPCKGIGIIQSGSGS